MQFFDRLMRCAATVMLVPTSVLLSWNCSLGFWENEYPGRVMNLIMFLPAYLGGLSSFYFGCRARCWVNLSIAVFYIFPGIVFYNFVGLYSHFIVSGEDPAFTPAVISESLGISIAWCFLYLSLVLSLLPYTFLGIILQLTPGVQVPRNLSEPPLEVAANVKADSIEQLLPIELPTVQETVKPNDCSVLQTADANCGRRVEHSSVGLDMPLLNIERANFGDLEVVRVSSVRERIAFRRWLVQALPNRGPPPTDAVRYVSKAFLLVNTPRIAKFWGNGGAMPWKRSLGTDKKTLIPKLCYRSRPRSGRRKWPRIGPVN